MGNMEVLVAQVAQRIVLALDVHMLQPRVHVSPCVEIGKGLILTRRCGSTTCW